MVSYAPISTVLWMRGLPARSRAPVIQSWFDPRSMQGDAASSMQTGLDLPDGLPGIVMA
jgi:hypothetical protein